MLVPSPHCSLAPNRPENGAALPRASGKIPPFRPSAWCHRSRQNPPFRPSAQRAVAVFHQTTEIGCLALKWGLRREYKLEDAKRKGGRDGSLGRSFSPIQMGWKKGGVDKNKAQAGPERRA
jgi:hypothetical protein